VKSNFLKYLALALVLPMLFTLVACAKPATSPPLPTPAAFEVTSLVVTPPEVTAGETASVTVKVKNTGGSEGTYNAVLTIDGVTVGAKQVTLAPGASKTISFSPVKDKAGTYQIGIGGLTSKLTVKAKLVVKEVELKYDDGTARDTLSAGPSGGYLIDFSPPALPFTIKKVRIYGILKGSGWEGKNFQVEIWDKNYKVLNSATYPVTKFTTNSATWVEVEVPDIEVSDKFYVHVYTGTGYLQGGISLGADDSVVNEHSGLTIRTVEGVSTITATWSYTGWCADKSKVNWMIRVVGTGMMAGS